jgi:ATP-dependent helicase/DNAse subunit B
MLKDMPELLRREFLEIMEATDLDKGNNLLVYTGIEQMLRNYLLFEKNEIETKAASGIPTTLLGLERKVQFEMQVEFGNVKTPIFLGGTADRIDREGNTVRVLDYKTGKVEPKNLKLKDLLEIAESPEKEKSLQLLLYMLAWKTQSPEIDIVPGIIAIKMPSKGVLTINFEDERDLCEIDRHEIEEAFSVLVKRILDPNEPFNQTDDLKQCAYCSFTGICNR